MCRQNVVSSGFHDLSQSLPDVDPQHPQYQFISAERRKIRKWKLRNQRTSNNIQSPETTISDISTLSKKEARKLKNRESAALSRKRKMNEIAEVQNLVMKLNQENIALRQRISMLEASVQSSIFPQQNGYQQQQSVYQQLQQNVYQQSQQNVYQEPQQSMSMGLGSIETASTRNQSPYPHSTQFIQAKNTISNIPRPVENGFPFLYEGNNLIENSQKNQIQNMNNTFIAYPSISYQNPYSTQFSQSGR